MHALGTVLAGQAEANNEVAEKLASAKEGERLLGSRFGSFKLRLGGATASLVLIGIGICMVAHNAKSVVTSRISSSHFQNLATADGLDSGLKGLADGFCGINTGPGFCGLELNYLEKLNGGSPVSMYCKEVFQDKCSFTVIDGSQFDLETNPNDCVYAPAVLFLWNSVRYAMDGDPTGMGGDPLCGVTGFPSCEVWASTTWKKYADKWGPELEAARKSGLQVASPQFDGPRRSERYAYFFASCPECSQKGSNYYIDIIAFNTGVAYTEDRGAMATSISWVNGQASHFKRQFDNRPVVLASIGLGAPSVAAQADFIYNSGIFDKDGNDFDAVYFYVGNAMNAMFSMHQHLHSDLQSVVESGPRRGKTLGQVLLDKCSSQR